MLICAMFYFVLTFKFTPAFYCYLVIALTFKFTPAFYCYLVILALILCLKFKHTNTRLFNCQMWALYKLQSCVNVNCIMLIVNIRLIEVNYLLTYILTRTWHILAQEIARECCCLSRRVQPRVHGQCSRKFAVQVRRAYAMYVYVYCLCIAYRVSFSTRAPV